MVRRSEVYCIFMKLKREWIYTATGAFLALASLWYLISAFVFLVRELGRALDPGLIKTPEVARFNLDKMKELKIPGVE